MPTHKTPLVSMQSARPSLPSSVPTMPIGLPHWIRTLAASPGSILNRFFGTPAHLPVLPKIAPTGGTPGGTTSNGSVLLPMIDNGNNDNCQTQDRVQAGDSAISQEESSTANHSLPLRDLLRCGLRF